MTKRGNKFSFSRWCDEWKMVGSAILEAFSHLRFIIAFFVAFFLFGTIMNMFAGGAGSIGMIKNGGISAALDIIGKSFLSVFGINRYFADWIFIFLVSLFQAVLIGLLVVVLKHRKDADSIQNAGLAAGLAILGSGCPTCGTTLLMPVLMSIFGSSSFAMAGTVSFGLTAASVLLALFAIKKLGVEAFAIFEDEKFRAKRKEKDGHK